jgi:hypothetical protein
LTQVPAGSVGEYQTAHGLEVGGLGSGWLKGKAQSDGLQNLPVLDGGSTYVARCQERRSDGSVADQLRGKFPKLGALVDEAENDLLAFMTIPRAHWTQIYSTNPLERLNAEIKRRTNVPWASSPTTRRSQDWSER